MTEHEDGDRLFRILCARALQRAGEGFPSTDEEIARFEESSAVTSEQQAEFIARLDQIVDRAFEEAGCEADPEKKPCVFDKLNEMADTSDLAAAARKARGKELSDELRQRIEGAIEGDSEKDESKKDEDDRE